MLFLLDGSCLTSAKSKNAAKEREWAKFPYELVNFTSYQNNPVFTGSETNTWDQKIRERGYILKENKSSPVMVFDGKVYRLYTMHSKINLHFPVKFNRSK